MRYREEKMTPKINQKVKIVRVTDNKPVFGTIVKLYPPTVCHSGRFDVLIHDHNRTYISEFWYSDYGKTVICAEKEK